MIPELFVYLLKVNLALILFYGVYYFLLRHLTFYSLNRYYLLFAYVFSISYPWINLREWFTNAEHIPVQIYHIVPDWEAVQARSVEVWPLLQWLFWVVLLYFIGRFLIRLISLWRIHRASVPARWQYFHYRQVYFRINPFTFWKNIYVHREAHQDRELLDIFSHEQVHVEQLHTMDTLIAEFMTILCWFNPVSWLMRHSIRENLEFITDRRVLQSGVDKRSYQFSLLNLGTSGAPDELVTHFNLRHLKTRILMMNKKKSSKVQVSKYLIGTPLIVLFVLIFTMSIAFEAPVSDPITKPLLVVDGQPNPNQIITDLDLGQIERIVVYKGDVAVSHYPNEVQAQHGVVEIELKKEEVGIIDRESPDGESPDLGVRANRMIKGDPSIPKPKQRDSLVRLRISDITIHPSYSKDSVKVVTGKPVAIRVKPASIENDPTVGEQKRVVVVQGRPITDLKDSVSWQH